MEWLDLILAVAFVVVGFFSGRFTGGTKELLIVIGKLLEGAIKDRDELKDTHPKVEKKLPTE